MGVSGAKSQLCSVHQAVCPEEGAPAASVSPQVAAFPSFGTLRFSHRPKSVH